MVDAFYGEKYPKVMVFISGWLLISTSNKRAFLANSFSKQADFQTTSFSNEQMSTFIFILTKFRNICDALRNLVLFAQFKRKTHMEECQFQLSCRQKVTLLHGCFSRFSICANGTKSLNASQEGHIKLHIQRRFQHKEK